MADRRKTDSGDEPVTKANWAAGTAKNPDDFDDEQDEAMTDEQIEQLSLLSKEANLPLADTLTRSEAERRIQELRRRTGKKP